MATEKLKQGQTKFPLVELKRRLETRLPIICIFCAKYFQYSWYTLTAVFGLLCFIIFQDQHYYMPFYFTCFCLD